jgi:hypothetical protein
MFIEQWVIEGATPKGVEYVCIMRFLTLTPSGLKIFLLNVPKEILK